MRGIWVDAEPVVVVTGATSGIGLAAARSLAESGARVIMAARDTRKAAAACERIERELGRECTGVVECDLASFASVRSAAEELCDRFPAIDVLVDNAGVITPVRSETVDGHELTFQVNHLSHFLLTNLLRPALTAAAPSRVVVVSSDAHFAAWRGLDFRDLESRRRYSPFGAYAASKLANIMFAYELAERWAGSGIAANALHPGPVASSWGMRGWGPIGAVWNTFVPKMTPEQGADTLEYLALSPDVEGATGRYYYRRRPKAPARPARDAAARRRLWDVSAELTGVGGGPVGG